MRYLPAVILLVIIAATMRDDFALTLIYLFAGAFALGSWWSSRALAQVNYERQFSSHVFFGEKIEVRLRLNNHGWLPVLWLKLQEALPVGLSSSPTYTRVTGLGANAHTDFGYVLEARKRGYYALGPLFITSGDLLGLSPEQQLEKAAQHITVYPRIIALSQVKIPSRSPQGTLRHKQPVFEDPSRLFSKRDYVAGDSLRRVDWKATASSGRMQVKLFEASISLETLIILDLETQNYDYHSRIDSGELAIVIAASLATWIAGKHQTVGLKINGLDTPSGGEPQYLPPRKGQAHLIRILETLARAKMTEATSLGSLIQQQRSQLPWGTTLIVISGQAGQPVLNELHQARRAGQNALLILAGPVGYSQEITRQAALLGIPVVGIANERELDIWRK